MSGVIFKEILEKNDRYQRVIIRTLVYVKWNGQHIVLKCGTIYDFHGLFRF